MSADSGLPGVTLRADQQTSEEPKFTIQVYLKNGNVFEYDVTSRAQAREHSAAIIAGGYRSVSEEAPHVLTHWPAHQIEKVKVTGNQPIQTNYFDRQRGT
jgi:hypothetical protein